MFARTIQRQSRQSVRTFASTAKAFSGHPEGAYNNLPFKVKNRRIPYAIPHIIFWGMYLVSVI